MAIFSIFSQEKFINNQMKALNLVNLMVFFFSINIYNFLMREWVV